MADVGRLQQTMHSRNGLLDQQFSTGYGKPVSDVMAETHTLLGQLGSSCVEPVAYDTAWLARLGPIDINLATQALEWLRAHQLADGSWGALTPLYHHDRVICTLAALIAFVRNGAPEDRPRIQAALPALQHSLANLDQDIAGRTIAFEMLLPSLVAEARTLGLTVKDPSDIVRKLSHMRDAKLVNAPKGLVSRYTTLGFSTETVGPNGLHLLDLDNLQYSDGSVCFSPAATAFFATYVNPDPAALEYLHRVARYGGAPTVTTIDVFEHAWGVWNITRSRAIDETTFALCRPHLDVLASAWRPGYGIAMASAFTIQDGDDTGTAYEVLARFDRAPDLSAIWRYEQQSHFRCYDLENDPSISANIHILGALRQAGLSIDHPAVQKIATFLYGERKSGQFWVDKWHSSPYYPTSHAVIAGAGYLDQLVKGSVEWILATQRPNGSWGYYGPTAEETAYCLQALITWHQHGLPVPQEVLSRGVAWLAAHAGPTHSPLWIGKCLYCPTLVVQSAILAALQQYEYEFGALPEFA
jgi:halimadienyl-diphosphate synthase